MRVPPELKWAPVIGTAAHFSPAGALHLMCLALVLHAIKWRMDRSMARLRSRIADELAHELCRRDNVFLARHWPSLTADDKAPYLQAAERALSP